MDSSRLVRVTLSPKAVSRFFPYRSPGEQEIDRVEAAFLASLGYIRANLQDLLIDERDHAAFVVLHNLVDRKIFRVSRPFVEILHGNSRLKVYPVYIDRMIERSILDQADLIAIVDRSGDVVYYEISLSNL